MNEVFVDTCYWLAMLNFRDAYHQQAIGIPRPARMVTTRAVQIEVMDAFSGARQRALAVRFWRRTNNNSRITIVRLDDPLLHRAALLFQNRPDKEWSMTDCISFVVMQDRRITQALTNDHHFEQAGFQCLLKRP
jgi:predicted nucleic acid-binding protein